MRPGKESVIAKNRQRMSEAQHSSNNAFVKSEQAKLKAKAGKEPNLPEGACYFDAYMMNNGEHAQKLAKKLTKDIDHEAFPVK
jgi:cell division protein YceG involved in septum cleavage